MKEILDEFDLAIAEADSLKKLLRGSDTKQVRSAEERSLAKATSLAWFNNHRTYLTEHFDDEALSKIDSLYRRILDSSQKAGIRDNYLKTLKALKSELVGLRSENILRLSSASPPRHSSDLPPSFSPLIADAAMQEILGRRWIECVRCVENGAPLAAIVMMGGLLEALLLSRIHREPDKAPIFKAKTAPTDNKTGKSKPLNEWGLRNYLDVTHEMGWITPSAKGVGEVLRDYRNYIHPHKELTHGVPIVKDDSVLLWEVSKTISRQIIESVP